MSATLSCLWQDKCFLQYTDPMTPHIRNVTLKNIYVFPDEIGFLKKYYSCFVTLFWEHCERRLSSDTMVSTLTTVRNLPV